MGYYITNKETWCKMPIEGATTGNGVVKFPCGIEWKVEYCEWPWQQMIADGERRKNEKADSE